MHAWSSALAISQCCASNFALVGVFADFPCVPSVRPSPDVSMVYAQVLASPHPYTLVCLWDAFFLCPGLLYFFVMNGVSAGCASWLFSLLFVALSEPFPPAKWLVLILCIVFELFLLISKLSCLVCCQTMCHNAVSVHAAFTCRLCSLEGLEACLLLISHDLGLFDVRNKHLHAESSSLAPFDTDPAPTHLAAYPCLKDARNEQAVIFISKYVQGSPSYEGRGRTDHCLSRRGITGKLGGQKERFTEPHRAKQHPRPNPLTPHTNAHRFQPASAETVPKTLTVKNISWNGIKQVSSQWETKHDQKRRTSAITRGNVLNRAWATSSLHVYPVSCWSL